MNWTDLNDTIVSQFPAIPRSDREIAVLDYPNRLQSFPHTHTFFQIVYVLDGHCMHYISQTPSPLNTGDLCIIPPHCCHHFQCGSDCTLLLLMVQPFVFSELFSNCETVGKESFYQFIRKGCCGMENDRVLLFRTQTDDAIRGSFLDMYREMFVSDCYTGHTMRHLLSIFLIALLRHHEKTMQIIIKKNSNTEIIALIWSSYNTITLSKLADYLHYTVPYCSKYLKKNLGCTFSQLLWKIRSQKAVDLLLNSDKTVCQISIDLGYENPESFIRAFKREFHMTPSQYRLDFITAKS